MRDIAEIATRSQIRRGASARLYITHTAEAHTIMAAVHRQDRDDSEQLRLHALEKKLRALCDHVVRLVDDARGHESLAAREASLQLEAFAERRSKALEYLNVEHREPCCIQLGNLEKLLEALECSRKFFAAKAPSRIGNEISADRLGLVR